MVPLFQKEADTFVKIWNTHRIRMQKNTLLPDCVPNHIYAFPGNYGLQDQGQYSYIYKRMWVWSF